MMQLKSRDSDLYTRYFGLYLYIFKSVEKIWPREDHRRLMESPRKTSTRKILLIKVDFIRWEFAHGQGISSSSPFGENHHEGIGQERKPTKYNRKSPRPTFCLLILKLLQAFWSVFSIIKIIKSN